MGPIRSARLSDLQLTPMLRAILVHVGAQAETLDRIRDAAKDTAEVQVPPLPFGENTATGKDVGTFTVPYAGDSRVTYEAATDGFKRTQGGRPSDPAPTNVIVIKTDIKEVPGYVEDELGSLSLDIRSTGDGPVVVLSGGKRYDGQWTRNGNDSFRFMVRYRHSRDASAESWKPNTDGPRTEDLTNDGSVISRCMTQATMRA